MIKAIKKLFSVEDEDLDFDNIETTDEKSNIYKKSLNHNNEHTPTQPLNVRELLEEQGNKIKEVESNKIEQVSHTGNFENIIPLKADDIINHNVSNDDNSVNSRAFNFDFEKEIEDAYNKSASNQDDVVKVVETEKKVVSVPVENKKEEKTKEPLYTKDNYVLQDIISPMGGIIKKGKGAIKKEEPALPSTNTGIIKLRNRIKTREIDPDVHTENYKEDVDFSSKEGDSLEDALNKLSSKSEKEVISETSKFTLVEDATGEMKLVIDED